MPKRRKLDWRIPDPKKWRNGGFKPTSGETHGPVKQVFSRDFPATEGSWRCIKCLRWNAASDSHCAWCRV